MHYSAHWKVGWALVMDIAHIKTITSRAIKKTGTLIVKLESAPPPSLREAFFTRRQKRLSLHALVPLMTLVT